MLQFKKISWFNILWFNCSFNADLSIIIVEDIYSIIIMISLLCANLSDYWESFVKTNNCNDACNDCIHSWGLKIILKNFLRIKSFRKYVFWVISISLLLPYWRILWNTEFFSVKPTSFRYLGAGDPLNEYWCIKVV